MSLIANGVVNARGVNDRTSIVVCGFVNSVARSAHRVELQVKNKLVELQRDKNRHVSTATLGAFNCSLFHKFGVKGNYAQHGSSQLRCSAGMPDMETEETVQSRSGSQNVYREDAEGPYENIHLTAGLADACKFVYNDAKYVNERARSDIFLLSRGIQRLDARARQDVAILGLEFLKIDARAREDTEKVDRGVKEKAERLHNIGTKLKEKAQIRLMSVAEKHWNDGALKADLRRADLRAKQRAMEDALMALEFVKNIHDMMVSKVYNFPLNEKDSVSTGNPTGRIMIEKNGINLDFTEVSADRISAIEEAYWCIASALYDADGIDYTDPEDLELLVTTLIDLDAMDGKSSVSLLAECSSSPDVNTRKALANALAAAPSMWTLGNAGMGALQRLAEDSNLAVAAAASKAIYELKKQWEIEEGDSWRFTMNQNPPVKEYDPEADTDDK
uniref:Senescence-associated protein SPA15, chloroplastic n=1 Tax=Kalanchoe fedtschenkoi TaxID=63787 RepID=A0A7N0U5L1_KALFE